MPAEARPQPPARPVVSCEQNRSPHPGLGMLPVGWSLTSCRVPAIFPGGLEDASGSVTPAPSSSHGRPVAALPRGLLLATGPEPQASRPRCCGLRPGAAATRSVRVSEGLYGG